MDVFIKEVSKSLSTSNERYSSVKDSVYADLKWACKKLRLDNEWDFKLSPLEATNKKTGQKIFFRGLDDWQKIASITIDDPNLVLCFEWFEEAFEIVKEETYNNTRMFKRLIARRIF